MFFSGSPTSLSKPLLTHQKEMNLSSLRNPTDGFSYIPDTALEPLKTVAGLVPLGSPPWINTWEMKGGTPVYHITWKLSCLCYLYTLCSTSPLKERFTLLIFSFHIFFSLQHHCHTKQEAMCVRWVNQDSKNSVGNISLTYFQISKASQLSLWQSQKKTFKEALSSGL